MTTNNNPKQTIWEIWFISSILILLTLLFTGIAIEELYKDRIYINILIIAFINTLSAIIVGIKK